MTVSTGSNLAHVVGAEGLVLIHLRSGEIKLRGVDGDTARVREVSGHDLGELFTIEAEEGSLSLKPTRGLEIVFGSRSYRRGFGRQSAELEVEVPKRATVVIETESGEIDARDLAGEQQYHSASGEVTLRSVSGRVTVEVVSGDVEMTAVDVTALAIQSVSGDVDVKAETLEALESQTTSGDMDIAGRLAGSGPFTIETVSGDALVALAGAVRVEMSTVTGDLSSDFDGAQVTERGKRSITLGSGGPTLSVRTMSGDLHVRRARVGDTAPVVIAASATPSTEPLANGAIAAAYEDARLRILRSLERGEIDIAEAGRRLETLDAGDPDFGDPNAGGLTATAPGAKVDRADG
jgi:hypothetical protein